MEQNFYRHGNFWEDTLVKDTKTEGTHRLNTPRVKIHMWGTKEEDIHK